MPYQVPFYEWETDFDVINKEHDLILTEGGYFERIINLKGNASFYWVKDASIYSQNKPIVEFLYLFDDNKLISIYVVVWDQVVYHGILEVVQAQSSSTLVVDDPRGTLNWLYPGRRTIISTLPRRRSEEKFGIIVLTDMYSSAFKYAKPYSMPPRS